MFQKLRKSIAFKFLFITTVLIVVWLAALATLIINGTNKALSKQANVFTVSLGEEQKNEEALLREALVKKRDAILAILTQTAAGLISNYDYDTLGMLAKNTALDSDVTFVVFYDSEGETITENPPTKSGYDIVRKTISTQDEVIGSIEIGIDDAAIKTNMADVVKRFENITVNAKNVQTEANVSLLRLITVGSLAGLGLICVALFLILSRVVISPITKTSNMIRDIAQGEGDLTKRMDIQSEDEIGELGQWFNDFIDNIQTIVSDVMSNAKLLNSSSDNLAEIAHSMSESTDQTSIKCDTVARSTDEINQSTTTVAKAMEEASSNISHVASATEEMTATINEIADNTEKAKLITDGAVKQSQSASKQVGQLGKAAVEIGNVIQTITDISEQVNLLALNATIEAARAGDAGKGFAVVANEIKDLAHQTATATEEIKTRVNDIQASTEGTVTEINNVASVVNNINAIVATIAAAIEEQSATTSEIASNVAQVSIGINDVSDNVAQNSTVVAQIASDIEEVTNATNDISSSSTQLDGSSQELSRLASQLHSMMGRFKV